MVYWWETQRKRDHYEGEDVGGWIILRWFLESKIGVEVSELVWLRIGMSGDL
jgi:hypothetical protein